MGILGDLATEYVTMFGTETDKETPGEKREIQVECDGSAIFVGEWATDHFGDLLAASDLPCMDHLDPANTLPYLMAALTEGLQRWPEDPFGKSPKPHALWGFMPLGDFKEYFDQVLADSFTGQEWVVAHLLPLVVRAALDSPNGRQLMDVQRARVAHMATLQDAIHGA